MGWRLIEFALGAWLIAGRLVLPTSADDAGSFVHDVIAGTAVIALATLACASRMRGLRPGIAAIALELVLLGRFGETHPRSPVAESYILVGLLLLMTCILPTRLVPVEPRASSA